VLPRCGIRVRWRRTPRLISGPLRCCFFALLKSGPGTLRRTLGSRPRPTLPNLGEAEVVQVGHSPLPAAPASGHTAPVAAHLARHTVICPDRRIPRAASLLAPYFRRRNGLKARAVRATERRQQVSKPPSGQKSEQNRARDGSDRNHIDEVVRGHRQSRGHMGERPARLCLRALLFL